MSLQYDPSDDRYEVPIELQEKGDGTSEALYEYDYNKNTVETFWLTVTRKTTSVNV